MARLVSKRTHFAHRAQRLHPAERDASLQIPVGVAGWTYAPWRNNFFPEGLPHRRELQYASRQLTAIEVNG